jgi:CBS domain containing-hemolysin-like protein
MLSTDACETLATVRVATVNDRLGLHLPDEADFDTIGGFVFHQFGRIPEVGETIESHDARLEVLAATRRRIDLVRVERLGGPRRHDR